jgi:hypothetical protein
MDKLNTQRSSTAYSLVFHILVGQQQCFDVLEIEEKALRAESACTAKCVWKPSLQSRLQKTAFSLEDEPAVYA